MCNTVSSCGGTQAVKAADCGFTYTVRLSPSPVWQLSGTSVKLHAKESQTASGFSFILTALLPCGLQSKIPHETMTKFSTCLDLIKKIRVTPANSYMREMIGPMTKYDMTGNILSNFFVSIRTYDDTHF